MAEILKLNTTGAAAAALALAIGCGGALAGGLAVREQSTNFLGSSYAGDGAGGALSSGFWNPAAYSEAKWGWQTETSSTVIFGSSEVTSRAGTTNPVSALGVPTPGLNQADDIGRPAFVGASYAAYRISDKVVFGLAIDAPFGLSTEASANSASQFQGRSGKVQTISVDPSFAIDLTSTLSLGLGAQIQYGKISFKAAAYYPGTNNLGYQIDDISVGGTVGLLWKPVPGTSIGLGYRSPIHHDFDGDAFAVGNTVTVPTALVPGGSPMPVPYKRTNVSASLTLPESVTLSLRQAIAKDWRVLGTVEWTKWSRVGSVNVIAGSTGGANGVSNQPGATVSNLSLNWDDGWMFAFGGEYDVSPVLTLRAGAAYEISPIQNASQRFDLITDSNRVWASGGLTYKWSDKVSLDFAYSHIFFDNASINRSINSAGLNAAQIADVQSSVDIVSAGLKVAW